MNRITSDTWNNACQQQEYAAENRANILRIVAVGLFYLVELLNRYGLHIGSLRIAPVPGVDDRFHLAMTCVALVWVSVALATAVALKQHRFKQHIKYFTTAADALVLTMLLLVADGPRSPLIVGYYLIVGLCALRLSLRLVWVGTALGILGYLVVIGNAFWYRQQLRVPRYHELIFLIGLILLGVCVGQTVCLVRRLALELTAPRAPAQA